MLIELSSLADITEALRAIIGSKSAISLHHGRHFQPKFQAEGVVPTNHSSSQKTMLNDLLEDVKNLDRSFFRFVVGLMHAFDRQTDGQSATFLIASLCWHSMQHGKYDRSPSRVRSPPPLNPPRNEQTRREAWCQCRRSVHSKAN